MGYAGDSEAVVRVPLPNRSESRSAAATFSNDLMTFVVGGKVFRFAGATPVARLDLDSPMYTGGFTDDDKWLVLGHQSGATSLYRRGEWANYVWKLPNREHGLLSTFQESPDGTKLALGFERDIAVLVDLRTGNVLQRLEGHAQAVTAIAWAPDGKRIATGSSDHTVRLWDAASGRQLCQVGSHVDGIGAMRFLPGGRTLVSVSKSGAKFWTTEDRR